MPFLAFVSNYLDRVVLGLGEEVIEIRYTPFRCLYQSNDQYDHTIVIRLGSAAD